MVYKKIIHGNSVDLRPVEKCDAAYIIDLRNSQLARYLHPVGSSIEAQEQWIEKQRSREGDYYFMMLDKEGERIGTVGLSSIIGECGETSRFISTGTPLQNTETNLLITDFAFSEAGLTRIEGYVSTDNISVISLQKRFGYVFEDEVKEKDGIPVRYARLLKEDYLKKRPRIVSLIERLQ